jgi:hypothetical protein
MASNEAEPLRPKLEAAQRTLEDALSRACSADVREADTGELIRIEEVLAIANQAAKEAISVRRRLGRDQPRKPKGSDTHREFEDATGTRWTAFAVNPSTITTGRAQLREPYQQGWLAFDCGSETRRLAPTPEGWMDLSEEELCRLCDKATIAPRRARSSQPRQPPGASEPSTG